MATSPSHRWGQIIGQEFLEVAMYALLSKTAKKHNLYLDQKGQRTARPGKKIAWRDMYGNTHDLDFVLEKPEKTGSSSASRQQSPSQRVH